MRAWSGLRLFPTLLAVCSCSGEDASSETSTPESSSSADADTAEPFVPPKPDDCITDVSPGTHVVDCGTVVTFSVTVPAQCETKACGLVFDIHGGTMTGDFEDRHTGMRALGKKRGYIVVQPTAPGGASPLWIPAAHDPIVFSFLKRTIRVFHVDEKRVHFMGLSQGGSMTWRFLCNHADILASVAPTSESPRCGGFGDTPADCFQSDGRVPKRQIPLFYTHGTKDAIQPFPCAEEARDAVLEGWKMKHEEIVEKAPGHLWKRWHNDEGTVFEFLQHDYAANASILKGHCFPGAPDKTALLACQGSPFSWGEVVLDFFEAHPKK